MKHYKTSLGLIVVDFESLAETITQNCLSELITVYGVYEQESIPKKDMNRLLMFFTLKHVLNTQKLFNDKKNVIFYVNSSCKDYITVKNKLKLIAKALKVPVYTNTLNFNCINSKSGESIELLNSIKEFRYNFEPTPFSPRILESFLKKHNIKPESIT